MVHSPGNLGLCQRLVHEQGASAGCPPAFSWRVLAPNFQCPLPQGAAETLNFSDSILRCLIFYLLFMASAWSRGWGDLSSTLRSELQSLESKLHCRHFFEWTSLSDRLSANCTESMWTANLGLPLSVTQPKWSEQNHVAKLEERKSEQIMVRTKLRWSKWILWSVANSFRNFSQIVNAKKSCKFLEYFHFDSESEAFKFTTKCSSI